MSTAPEPTHLNEPLAWIQDHWDWFFAEGFTAKDLAGRLLDDLAEDGLVGSLVENEGWVVVQTEDRHAFPEERFHRMVPAPEIARNRIRGESLALALASDLALGRHGAVTILAGDPPPDRLVDSSSLSEGSTCVFIRVNGSPEAELEGK